MKAKEGKILYDLRRRKDCSTHSVWQLEEMALVKTEAYSTFEYRHGPQDFSRRKRGSGKYSKRAKMRKKLGAELEDYGGKFVKKERLTKGPKDVFPKPIFSHILVLKIAETQGVDMEHLKNLGKVVVLDN